MGRSVVDEAVKRVKISLFPPRTLFFYGSLLRGVQMTSKLQTVFQPSFGVGAVLNVGASMAKEEWIIPIVGGWFLSGGVWKLAGASVPQTKVYDKNSIL